MPSAFIVAAREKLQQLRTADTELRIFGADTHQYRLAAPITQQQLDAFEQRHRCKLPIGYKAYLQNLGNGGAGPDYGIFPLGMMDDGYRLAPWSDAFVCPSKPFPFTAAFNDTSMLSRGEPQQSDYPSEEAYYQAHDQWADEHYEQLQEEYWERHALDGAIPIVHHGCALRSWLVVAQGPEYGHIWRDDTPDEQGVRPLHSAAHPRYTFELFYLDWLERALASFR